MEVTSVLGAVLASEHIRGRVSKSPPFWRLDNPFHGEPGSAVRLPEGTRALPV